MQADEIGFRKDAFFRATRRAFGSSCGCRRRVVIQNPHRKSGAAPRHRLSDPAHSQNSQRPMMHVVPHQHVDGPAPPFPGVNKLHALRQRAARPPSAARMRNRRWCRSSTSGVFVTRMPRSLAAATSMLSNPTATLAIMRTLRSSCAITSRVNLSTSWLTIALFAARPLHQLRGRRARRRSADVVDLGVLLQEFDGFGINAFGDQALVGCIDRIITSMAQLGFLGLGIMGYPMARHLVKAATKSRCGRTRRAKAQRARRRKARRPPARRRKEVAERADFIFYCVGDSAMARAHHHRPGRT